MLRRKTPNGTLAAGYDGTPVEWTTRPHAQKHILMPISDVGVQPVQQTPPINEHLQQPYPNPPFFHPIRSEESGFGSWKQGPHSPYERYSSGVIVDGDPGGNPGVNLLWRQKALQTPSLDSMLHQAPSAHQYYDMGGFQQVPTVLQPMWPPSVGPTSSNAQGPYGPYWPNGSFEPYRPAALRDKRFHAQFANFSINDPLEAQNKQQCSPHWRNETPTRAHPEGHSQWSTPVFGGRFGTDTSSSQDQSIIQRQDIESLRHDADQVQPMPLTHRNRPIPIRYRTSKSDDAAWSSIASPSPVQPLSLSSTEGGRQPTQLQFKEKVLVWAHRIYINLLASIQHARRQNQDRRQQNGRHQSQPSIFPKPPRHPTSISRSISDMNRKEVQSSGTYRERDGVPQSNESPDVIDVTRKNNPADSADFYWPYRRDSDLQSEQDSRGTRPSTHPQIQIRHHHSDSRQELGHTVPLFTQDPQPSRIIVDARAALEMLARLSRESGWKWTDGLLLGGCLAYGLGDYEKALQWYAKVLAIDVEYVYTRFDAASEDLLTLSSNVEAISNMAATFLALNRRKEAEQYWLRSVRLRPSYFEAVEHLIGLLCGDHRGREAVKIIDFVENALRLPEDTQGSDLSPQAGDLTRNGYGLARSTSQDGFPTRHARSSGYTIAASDNGRLIALIHAKGNMLYALGDNGAAAKAFENAIMIGAGNKQGGITGLIRQILHVFAQEGQSKTDVYESILLPPEMALNTARLVFPAHGELPGLVHIPEGQSKKAAISTTSNSLLSLAKIYQDGMSSGGARADSPTIASGVQDILALYYLSLSLQESPSTANNVGILLASVQHQKPMRSSQAFKGPIIPGVVPGSGIALALAYYNYGLNLDRRHAHLYTNLGSLLKDIGQLNAAIKMYEKAVECDGNFDIALANLANAVKDQGRISDAIGYYRRAVNSSPDFAEAVCGLANALNSVCGWQGRGGIVYRSNKQDRWHVNEQGMLVDAKLPNTESSGWIGRVVAIVEKQLNDGQSWGRGVLDSINMEDLLTRCHVLDDSDIRSQRQADSLITSIHQWTGQNWEGAKVVRLVERATKRLGWQLFQDKYVRRRSCSSISYARPQLPAALAIPSAPTVLPFHTFTCPLTAKQIRKISQRNGLRISCSTLRAPWLPAKIFDPPAPPNPQLNVGYVSSDFNNHPLAHLMQSVFGFHNPNRVKAFCYATTMSDSSIHRQQIEREAPVFYDASAWSVDRLVKQIVDDGIHILVNLNGYTRGARNEVFAARPAPIQMSFMGFAGTLGAEWCDYLLADTTAIPPQTLRPWRRNIDVTDQTRDENNSDEHEDWVYGENIIYTRDTFFCCDHRQSAPDAQEERLSWPEEQRRRWKMRKELFPELPDDTVILGNFNQLYKVRHISIIQTLYTLKLTQRLQIEPTTFRTWLRILSRLPKAILWLLRFPDLGETNLRQTALLWAGAEVASRIIFTDVAPKHQHISRARVCDLFLDTPECNAHTTAADVLWSGTPLLTFPRYDYKMCSRMAASILKGALPKSEEGDEAARTLIMGSDEEYEARAVELGGGLAASLAKFHRGEREANGGRLMDLRRILYESRWTSALFDTRRWVTDLEEAYQEAWRRWVLGEGGDIWL